MIKLAHSPRSFGRAMSHQYMVGSRTEKKNTILTLIYKKIKLTIKRRASSKRSEISTNLISFFEGEQCNTVCIQGKRWMSLMVGVGPEYDPQHMLVKQLSLITSGASNVLHRRLAGKLRYMDYLEEQSEVQQLSKVYTHAVLRQAWIEKLTPLSVRISLMLTLYPSGEITDESLKLLEDDEEVTFQPQKGNVCALDGWVFGVSELANFYASKLGAKADGVLGSLSYASKLETK
ncbi:hypothetical protein F2Q68_00041295 [Brassica cretica]|uniref:Uncharacterized protein n=1 Tax=Brassica cretica TaxID=69181 RepID=A0A8S9MSA4_BRACR|nr:hypothetical protein F2Q68_00041295 [Brassica cretica]